MSTDDDNKEIAEVTENSEDTTEKSDEDVSAAAATNVTQGVLPTQQGNEKALTLMSAFVVLVVGFLTSWPVIFIGLHGPDSTLFSRDAGLHRIATFPQALELLPEAPATLFGIALNATLVNGSTAGLHLGNLLLHALNAMLVFLICRRLFKKPIPDIAATIPAVLVASCPFIIETVGFLAARYVLQGTFFGLLFVLSILKHTAKEEPKTTLPILSLIWLACAIASWHCMIFLPVIGLLATLLRGGTQGLKRLGNLHISIIGLALLLCAAIWATNLDTAQSMSETMGSLLANQPILYLVSAFALPLLPHLLRPIAKGPVPVAAAIITSLAVLAGGYLASQDYIRMQSPIDYWADAMAQGEKGESQYTYILDAILASATRDEKGVMDKKSWELINQYATGATVFFPDKAQYHLQLGQSQTYLQDFVSAEQSLNKALALDPYNQENALMLAQVIDQQLQQGNASPNRIRDIIDLYESAELAGPLAPILQQRHAMLRLGLGDITGAYQRLLKAQGDSDTENPTLNQLATILMRAKELDQKSTELMLKNPGDPTGFAKQAEASMLRGELVRANYQIDHLLRRDTSNAELWNMLGMIRGQLGLGKEFVADWGASPTATNEVWRSMGQRCAMSGAWDDARIYMEQIKAEEEPAPLLLIELARIALQMQQVPRALQYLTEATQTYPDRYEPWAMRAELAIAMKQTREAEDFIKQAKQRGMSEEQLKKIQESMKASGQSTMGETTRTIIR